MGSFTLLLVICQSTVNLVSHFTPKAATFLCEVLLLVSSKCRTSFDHQQKSLEMSKTHLIVLKGLCIYWISKRFPVCKWSSLNICLVSFVFCISCVQVNVVWIFINSTFWCLQHISSGGGFINGSKGFCCTVKHLCDQSCSSRNIL